MASPPHNEPVGGSGVSQFGKSHHSGGPAGRAKKGARDPRGNKIGGQFTAVTMNNVVPLVTRQQKFSDPFTTPTDTTHHQLYLDPTLRRAGGQALANWLISSVPSTSPDEMNPPVILHDLNLSGASLEGAQLKSVHLVGANLTGVNFRGAQLVNVDLSHANLTGADMRYSTIVNSRLAHARAGAKRWWKSPSGIVDFSGSSFVDTDCYAMRIPGSSLDNIRISGASDWSHVDIRGSSMVGATILNGTWVNAKVDPVHAQQARWDIHPNALPDFQLPVRRLTS